MLGKKPIKVYDHFLKYVLDYKNPERIKKAIAAQPKMYDGEILHSAKLTIDSPDSEETLEDAEESRLKMRNKMVQINYGKLNALYEIFVPQQEFSVEETYFSIPSTSNNGSESKEVTSDLLIPKMPKESKLLKMFDTMGVAINGLRTRIDKTLLQDRQQRWMSDNQNSLREIYKTDEMLNIFESMEHKVNGRSPKENILQNEIDRLLEVSLTSEIQNCVFLSVEKQKNKLLKAKLEKSSSDSKDIEANLLKRIRILENDFKRSQAQSIDFEFRLHHLKEKMTCDISWKSKLSTINNENVLLKTQVDSVVKERENIKLEYQNLFNSIKATQTQHQKEFNELIEHVNQKTYAYADVRAQNQDLLMTISELKNKLKTIDKGKNVNTKFDKSETSRTLLCLESSNSIRRPKSKDTKSKDRVLKNNNDKRPVAHVRKMLSHLNFGTINQLTSKDLVDGLPKFKYNKDHLCSAYEQGKSKKASLPLKLVPSIKSKLKLLHMDLCGPMRVASISGKTYILVIVDDYSRYTWNRSIVHTRYNKTPYELIHRRKPNIQYFHVFGSLCYLTNDHDDFGKMKPKANIVPSKTDLDNLFGPLYEECYATSSPEVSDNSALNTLNNENTSSSSSIVIEEDEAPQIVSSSVEQVATEPNSPVLNENADELVQEDVAEFDENVFYYPPKSPIFEEAESSSIYLDPSNMHEFHQTRRSTDKCTKNHPIEQVIGDPSKPVMTRRQLHTDAKVCMYALTASTTKSKNIKEAILDANWSESMQDELNQFKCLDVWELFECPISRNIIAVK
ncbi:retrovirus-related pol polyprotein from transposon TNT 1-94 [Tanacetum coccineum]